MRHTRIVATVGPSCDSPGALDALIRAGVDVFRLNFSHGTHDTHKAAFDRIRQAAERADRVVAILQDLAGPKIRIGTLQGGTPIPLQPGDTLRLTTGDEVGRPGQVYTTYAPLATSVKPGQELLLDDGRISLRVESTDGTTIVTTVTHGASLGQHKGINAPGVALPAAGLTPKDAEDLRFGLSLGVDMVALSFVQSAADIQAARHAIDAAGASGTPIVAKLERPEGIAHLDAVLEQADAVMVARGDLGLEVPLERVPRLQKEITRRARSLGRPVDRRDAGARVDARGAASDPRRGQRRRQCGGRWRRRDHAGGRDGLGRVSREGRRDARRDHPDAEQLPPLAVPSLGSLMHAEHGRALCEAAVTLADRGRAVAIVAVTREGNTARMLAALRPGAQIFAATHRPEVARRLMLYRGVTPIVTSLGDSVDATGASVGQQLLARGLLQAGDEVVFVSVHEDPSRPASNFIKLHRLE